MNRATAWHQSTLDVIGNCSWRYFLTYVCGLPDPSGPAAKIGTAVHSAIEEHERERMKGNALTVDEMLEVAKAFVPAESVPAAEIAINNWYKSKMKDKSESHREWLSSLTPVEIEGYFTMPLVENAMPIGGTIDAIYHDDDGVYHIVDLKTAKDMSRWKKDGEGKRLQATMYSVAVQIKYNLDYLPDVTYAVCRTNTTGETAKRVTVYPDYADVRILGERIREAQNIVDTDNYVRNPGWLLCRKEWCPFYEGCMETGELCGTPATIRQNLLSRDAGDRQDNITASTTDHKEVTQ
jgi:hypothetical protein